MESQNLRFSPDEPYYGILNMLYGYYSPEEVENSNLKKFLQEVRWQLTSLFIVYFQQYGNEKVIPTLVEFLIPKVNAFYSIRDLLYILMTQQQEKSRASVFTNYMKDLFKSQKVGFDLIIALYSNIDKAITYKQNLKNHQSSPNNTSESKERVLMMNKNNEIVSGGSKEYKSMLDCCEHIISYSVHVLLSFNWSELTSGESGASKLISYFISTSRQNTGQQGIISSGINLAFGKTETFFSLITAANFSKPEEVVLLFLFHRRKQEEVKESYEREFLGEKAYSALLSHLLPNPSIFYVAEKEIPKKIVNMEEPDFNVPRMRLIYGILLANIRAFELPIQKKIVQDTATFLTNRAFMHHFLQIDLIFESICGYLASTKYLKEPIIKENIGSFYIYFIKVYWKHRKEHAKMIFKELLNFPQAEFLRILNLILDELLTEPLTYSTDEGIYTSIKFIYFLEDIALQNPDLLSVFKFTEIIAKTVLYLGEIKILYFWFPSYIPLHITATPILEVESFQREGGVVRAVLLLISSIILRQSRIELPIEKKKLALQLLNFFIFRKRKTFRKIATAVNASKLLTIETSEAQRNPKSQTVGEPFLEFTLKGSIIQSKLKLIFPYKTITYQRSVEEIYRALLTKKDFFDSIYFRSIFLLAQISQLIIYISLGISSYKEISEHNNKHPRTLYESYLAKLLGDILRASYKKEGSEGIKKCIVELYKESLNKPNHSIEVCITPLDDSIETLSTSVQGSKSPIKEASGVIESEKLMQVNKFQEEAIKAFTPICEYYCNFANKKITNEVYSDMALAIVTSTEFITKVQPGLHKIITEDLLEIRKAVIIFNTIRPRVPQRVSHPKSQSQE